MAWLWMNRIELHETCKCKCRLDLFGILVIVSVNMINHAMLVSISTMKRVSAGKH